MGGGGGSFRGKQKDLNYFVGNFVVIFFFFFLFKIFYEYQVYLSRFNQYSGWLCSREAGEYHGHLWR